MVGRKLLDEISELGYAATVEQSIARSFRHALSAARTRNSGPFVFLLEEKCYIDADCLPGLLTVFKNRRAVQGHLELELLGTGVNHGNGRVHRTVGQIPLFA